MSKRCQNPFSGFLLHIPGTMKNNDKKCMKIIAPLINFPLITIIPKLYGNLRQLPFYQCPIDNLPSKAADIMREIQEKEFVTQPPFFDPFRPVDVLLL
jgi:hypothetical protein